MKNKHVDPLQQIKFAFLDADEGWRLFDDELGCQLQVGVVFAQLGRNGVTGDQHVNLARLIGGELALYADPAKLHLFDGRTGKSLSAT